MPLVSTFYGIAIYMYNNGSEHNPPHFHAIFGECECIFSIKKCKKIKGYMPKNKLKMIEVWAELHQNELLDNWVRAKNQDAVVRINPLQ